jgi:transposase
MRAISEFQGIFIHRDPIDMRKAINGLCEIVESEGMGGLMGPNLFVFSGKRRNTLKILYFDKSGFALWQKRLENDKFAWPRLRARRGASEEVQPLPEPVFHLTAEQLRWLLDGYDVWKMKPFEELHFSRFS